MKSQCLLRITIRIVCVLLIPITIIGLMPVVPAEARPALLATNVQIEVYRLSALGASTNTLCTLTDTSLVVPPM